MLLPYGSPTQGLIDGYLLQATVSDIYGLLTECEVKMTGYWRSSFLFAFLWTETKLRYIKTLKKNEANISHLDQTSFVNKGFIIFAFEGMK